MPDLPAILTLRRSRCSRVSFGMGGNASRPLVAPSNHVANAVPNASPHRSAPMFPTAAAHIVDMPRAAPRLMSIAFPDSVSGWSCPSHLVKPKILHVMPKILLLANLVCNVVSLRAQYVHLVQ